jgi:hypothetical protein
VRAQTFGRVAADDSLWLPFWTALPFAMCWREAEEPFGPKQARYAFEAGACVSCEPLIWSIRHHR